MENQSIVLLPNRTYIYSSFQEVMQMTMEIITNISFCICFAVAMNFIMRLSFGICLSVLLLAIFKSIAIWKTLLVLFPNRFNLLAQILSEMQPAQEARTNLKGDLVLFSINVVAMSAKVNFSSDIPSVEVIDSIGTLATTNDKFVTVRTRQQQNIAHDIQVDFLCCSTTTFGISWWYFGLYHTCRLL